MTKIAFFDIDGTLCNSAGEVLASSVQAIQRFRLDGNLAYICTGRSNPEILDSILDIGFDGVIGAGGGYIAVGDTVIQHQTMPEMAVKEIVAYFDAHDIGYYLESNDGLFGSVNVVRKIEEEVAKIARHEKVPFETLNQKMTWFYTLIADYDLDTLDYSRVNKISFINNTLSFSTIHDKYQQPFHLYHSTVPLYGPESGEIAVKGVDKKKAVEQVLRHLGLSKEDALAYGDGDNDIAMFEAVGYSVAMANGTERLKAKASAITESADEDGIALSLNELLDRKCKKKTF